MKLKAAVLGLCLADFAGGSALAGDFAVTSPSVSEGATIGEKHLFAGFGCTGGNKSPALSWTRRSGRREEFRRHRLRSGCADRQRMVALGRLQHSRRHDGIEGGGG